MTPYQARSFAHLFRSAANMNCTMKKDRITHEYYIRICTNPHVTDPQQYQYTNVYHVLAACIELMYFISLRSE